MMFTNLSGTYLNKHKKILRSITRQHNKGLQFIQKINRLKLHSMKNDFSVCSFKNSEMQNLVLTRVEHYGVFTLTIDSLMNNDMP